MDVVISQLKVVILALRHKREALPRVAQFYLSVNIAYGSGSF